LKFWCCPIIKNNEKNFHAYFWLSNGIIGQRLSFRKKYRDEKPKPRIRKNLEEIFKEL